jgi:hypothetical protein
LRISGQVHAGIVAEAVKQAAEDRNETQSAEQNHSPNEFSDER